MIDIRDQNCEKVSGLRGTGYRGQVLALRAHCVHTAHAEAGILTQEYLSPDWLHSEATKPT